MFDHFDVDSKGRINSENVFCALKRSGRDLPMAQIGKMMSDALKTERESMSFEGFLTIMQSDTPKDMKYIEEIVERHYSWHKAIRSEAEKRNRGTNSSTMSMSKQT